MRDPRLDRLADVLVNYSTKVRPGQVVRIVSDPAGMPLVEAVYQAALKAGGHPFYQASSDALEEIMLQHGEPEQLTFVPPVMEFAVKTIDVTINLWAEVNTRGKSRMDPARQAKRQASRRPITKIFFDRTARGELHWVGTQYPTHASAQDAEMSLTQYEDFVFRAGLLHLPDPVGAWRAIFERQQRVCEYLAKKRELRFFVPPHAGHDGTDLRVNVDPARAKWINCAGTENFPDGEVFTGPQGVEGHVNYTYPGVYQGREAHGIRLGFKGGRVVEARAAKGEEFLLKMLDQDAGARNLGEIAIGTNYQIQEFSRNTLFDEKIGGTFHAAVGAGYPESGSTNESGLHWDMVCEMRPGPSRPGGVIEADGEVIQRDGRFVFADWPGR